MTDDLDTLGERIAQRLLAADPVGFAPILMPDGSARTCQWIAEDGWIIEYSTERVYGDHAKYAGQFVAMTYRPVGKGARGGRRTAQQWRRTWMRGFRTRKAAKARATALYYDHSPKRKARDGA